MGYSLLLQPAKVVTVGVTIKGGETYGCIDMEVRVGVWMLKMKSWGFTEMAGRVSFFILSMAGLPASPGLGSSSHQVLSTQKHNLCDATLTLGGLALQAFLRALAKAAPAKPTSLVNYRRMAAPRPPPERPLATADQPGDKALTTRALYAQVQVRAGVVTLHAMAGGGAAHAARG